MPALHNINSTNIPINKKTLGKLSFDIGERFSGRIISVDNGEILIRLPEGWQFKAKLMAGEDVILDKHCLFMVEDFSEGSLILKYLNIGGEGHKEKEGLLKQLSELGIELPDKEMAMLLLKHNLPITKENINFVKNTLKLWQEGSKNPKSLDGFIDKYIKVKGDFLAPLNSKEAASILKSAFTELSTLSPEEVLIFLENEVSFSKENIQSYKNLFREYGSLYDSLTSIQEKLQIKGAYDKYATEGRRFVEGNLGTDPYPNEKYAAPLENLSLANSELFTEGQSEEKLVEGLLNSEIITLEEAAKEASLDNQETASKNLEKTISEKEIVEEPFGKGEIEEKAVTGNPKEAATENSLSEDSSISSEDFMKLIRKAKSESAIKSKIEIDKNRNSLGEGIKEEIAVEIRERGRELKLIINSLLKAFEGEESLKSGLEKVLGSKFNDFKLMNHISKEYYYMDIPLKLKDREYPLKLVVKDSRGKGKTIDSKKIKLILTVATEKLGQVDGYLEVEGERLNLEIKAYPQGAKALKKKSEKLLSSLTALGYIGEIVINPKEEELDFSSMRSFFNDNSNVLVDVLV